MRTTVNHVLVVAILTTVYSVCLTAILELTPNPSHLELIVTIALVAGILTLFFEPLSQLTQEWLNRKLFKKYVDRYEKMYDLSRDIGTQSSPEEMTVTFLSAISESLNPQCAGLYLRSRDESTYIQFAPSADYLEPRSMSIENPLAQYFIVHPRPFTLDEGAIEGKTRDTRES